MASAISSSNKFIYRDADDDSHVIVEGKNTNAEQKTKVEGDKVVQLRKARTEESGFNWSDGSVKKVTLSNVMIVDDMDINCLEWFLISKIQINFSESALSVSPFSLSRFTKRMESLTERKVKAVSGSIIIIPGSVGGYCKHGNSMDALSACEKVGFKTIDKG